MQAFLGSALTRDALRHRRLRPTIRLARAVRRLKATLAFVAALALAPATLANGRFPRAQRLIESATDPNLVGLYGTYGLIVSSDAGRSWSHVCEAATGTYTGDDPLLEILPDGKLVARAQSALVRSGATWCDWKTILGGASASSVQDITRNQSDPMVIFALLGSYSQGQGFSSSFARSEDGGSTWSTPTTLPVVGRGLTIDVVPSSSRRLMVSGLDAMGRGVLLVSDDGGSNWHDAPIPMTDSNSAPYLAVISKNDPNRVFIRTDAYQSTNGNDQANDALLFSADGGSTWTTLIQRTAKLFGFALSPDESTVLVGYGDPVAPETYVAPSDVGIYRANVAALVSDLAHAPSHFEKIFDKSVTCLRWTTTGLFACTSQKDVGFEVGLAPGADFTLSDEHPFAPLLELPKVHPLPCAAGTAAYACYSDPINGFASVCTTFQASCDASAPPPIRHDADSGAAAGDGGSSDAGGPARSTTTSASGKSSCACRTAQPRRAGAAGLWGFAASTFVIALARRRRRR